MHGLEHVSAVLGIPRWWPTGARVGLILAHGARTSFADPLVEHLHRELTERRFLCLRFNFPFAEARGAGARPRRLDSPTVLRRCFRAAVGALARDPTASPAHLFLAGVGLGAQVAADLSISRLRADGLVLLGYPLHPAGKPEKTQAEQLYRVVSPMLFVQGTRDPFGTRDEVAGYRLSDRIEILWLEDGDHDLRPRRQVSGFTTADHLRTLAERASAWAARLAAA